MMKKNAYSKIDHTFIELCEEIESSHISYVYYFLILKVFGKAVFNSFTKWVLDTDQNDLHDSNVGLTANNIPKIFDYAGFDD